MAEECVCCGSPSKHSIQLAEGPQGSKLLKMPRYYLPNEAARDPRLPANLKEIHFCAKCMRSVEDAVRATILYLQAENDQLFIEET